jgi:glycosyltransferase involved in cell wall biosynthesis
MWMRAQGPYVPSLAPWLYQHAPRFDVVVFFTYLYFTTYAGLPAAAGLVPTVLHPTAHEEPPLYLPLYDLVFRLPAAFAFSTEEEELLIRRRFRVSQLTRVVGVGCDLDATGDGQAFREQFGLGDRPYLLYVGRVEPAKGSDELFTLFSAYKDRHPGPLELVVVGDPVRPMAAHPDIVVTGFVDESVKNGAYAGALAMVQPSYFESFSMVVVEAWAHGVPVIVQGRCDVLAGQARRSGGGIAYTGFAEFEAAVDVLLEERALARRLGEAGRRYVRARYSWEQVLDTYEVLLEQARVGRLSPAR